MIYLHKIFRMPSSRDALVVMANKLEANADFMQLSCFTFHKKLPN